MAQQVAGKPGNGAVALALADAVRHQRAPFRAGAGCLVGSVRLGDPAQQPVRRRGNAAALSTDQA